VAREELGATGRERVFQIVLFLVVVLVLFFWAERTRKRKRTRTMFWGGAFAVAERGERLVVGGR
jgi:hypothetical protein